MNCVEQTLPEDAGSFNEALMDLGQEVCIPRFPRCSECPIASWCRAHREGKEKELPVRTKKKKQETLYLAAALILCHGAFLMHKRPEKGMLASMWEFPMVLAHTPEEAERELGRRWNCRLEGPAIVFSSAGAGSISALLIFDSSCLTAFSSAGAM